MKRSVLTIGVLAGLLGPAVTGAQAEPAPTPALVAIADFDSDGDADSVTIDPTLSVGRVREFVPELGPDGCDRLPEPQRTACRQAFRLCERLPEPLRTACLDLVRQIFFTTVGAGTALRAADVLVLDVDGDGESEAAVVGAGSAAGVSLDHDEDVDVVWIG